MNYKNIVELQQTHKLSFDEAIKADSLGIMPCTEQAQEFLYELQEEMLAEEERLNDLAERGFDHGTDDPFIIDRIEQGEAFQDKYDMFMNEY